MQTTILRGAAFTLVTLLIAACGGTSARSSQTSSNPGAAEKAVRVAFGETVRCRQTGTTGSGDLAVQAYACYLPSNVDPLRPDAGCIVSGGERGPTSFYSCFNPHFDGACMSRRENRFTVAPAKAVPSPCLHHSMYEPVAVTNGSVAVEGWALESGNCPGQEGDLFQTCDQPLWIGADIHVCARGAPWNVTPEDFAVTTVDGRSLTGQAGGDGEAFRGRRIPAGRCVDGSIDFGPIDSVVADHSAPPTFAFQQHGTPAVDWTDPPTPAP